MTAEESTKYLNSKRRSTVFIIVFVAVMAVLAIYSLSVNNFKMSFSEAWTVVWDRICGNIPDRATDYYGWIRDYMVMEQSVPRTVASILVGVVLAVSGAVMQTITRNPLTDPYTIGISSAAMLGYCIALVYGVCVIPFIGGDAATMVNAFVFALIPSAAIIFVSSFKKLSPTMMILVGIGMMYMFSSFSTFIKFNASDESLQQIYEWGIGTMSSVGWEDLLPLLAAALLVLTAFMLLSKNINVLTAGDKVSQSLGVDPVRLRIICFLLISVAIAVVVCNTGTIGFVGLVAPHIARLFTGNDNRLLIPASATIGGMMVLLGDTLVRLLPGGLPVGVITALIGSPLFLYFLYRQRKQENF